MVTPNIVAPTSGRSSLTPGGGALTMPAMAAAALASTRAEIGLTPATSATEAIMVTSREPT